MKLHKLVGRDEAEAIRAGVWPETVGLLVPRANVPLDEVEAWRSVALYDHLPDATSGAHGEMHVSVEVPDHVAHVYESFDSARFLPSVEGEQRLREFHIPASVLKAYPATVEDR